MTTLIKRATVYLDSQLHKLLKVKSLETERSISDLVNEALRHEFLEDKEDLEAFQSRANEPTISFEELLKKLKIDGKI